MMFYKIVQRFIELSDQKKTNRCFEIYTNIGSNNCKKELHITNQKSCLLKYYGLQKIFAEYRPRLDMIRRVTQDNGLSGRHPDYTIDTETMCISSVVTPWLIKRFAITDISYTRDA